MRNITITTVNVKGQIVIPKSMRDTLGITPDAPLQVSLRDKGITIQPIDQIITRMDSENTLLSVLEATRGAWGPATPEEIREEKERRKR